MNIKHKTFSFRAAPHELHALHEYAEKRGIKASAAIRELICEKLFHVESTDFTGNQIFREGQKVEFYCKVEAEDDIKNNRPLTGIHVVKALERAQGNGYVVQTDKSKGSWVHVHWFKPVKP